MKFVACYEEPPQERLLKYVENEHSFNMEPFESHYDYELALNKICLSVANAKIIQLSGFCGLSRSMNSDCKVPDSKYGSLRIKDDLKFGFAYGINETELPVFINLQTGWVCIGNPHAKGNAV
ncbi:MAG: hypothetical protein NTX15_06430 [Candidatus Kapabacteria bacterium]|nr:hypothetical protein [Candidatus Kapabacteria bacterium]